MTRVRIDLFSSLDGYTSAGGSPENPMGEDWGLLTTAYVATRTVKERVFGDTSMFGLHSFPDDPGWKGWWGDEPPFGFPVYVLTSTAPRPEVEMRGGTSFRFRDASLDSVLAEASEAAGALDVRVGGGIGTARSFLRAGLVDDLHVAVAPVLLDRGHRVWEDLRGLERTHRMTSEVAESGTIHVTFSR
jgi:dihydrofolate reductase